jgi:hypothetical protein
VSDSPQPWASDAASGSPPLVVVVDSESPCSERAADARVMARALQRAGTFVPPTMELLSSARMACRRGDTRRAVIDAGTAGEAALAGILGLPPVQSRGLGGLVRLAGQRGVRLPADADRCLVRPRNDAVHRGLAPSHADVCRSLEIVEALVAQVEPDLIPASSLRPVNRPQRHDLLMIRRADRGPEASIPTGPGSPRVTPNRISAMWTGDARSGGGSCTSLGASGRAAR